MKKRPLIILVVICAFLLLSYARSFTTTGEQIELMDINEKSLVVKNLTGHITEVYFNPSKNNENLKVSQSYFIIYKYNVFKKPQLIDIQLVE